MSSLKPIFIHIHVPKTGGTSLNKVLSTWFQERHLNLYHDFNHTYTEQELDEIVLQNPQVISLASHSIRFFPPLLAGRPALYYCLLREPIDAFISYFTFIKKNYQWFTEEHRRTLPENPESKSIKELVREHLTKEMQKKLRGNWTNYFFAIRSFRQQAAFVNKLQPSAPEDEENARFQSFALPVSMTILNSFALVGLMERFDESVEALRQLIGTFGIPVSKMTVPQTNVSNELRENTDWINESDELGKQVLDLFEKDRLLYAYSKERFQKTLQAIETASKACL